MNKGLDPKKEFFATPSASESNKHEGDKGQWFAGHIGGEFERYIYYLKKYKNKILDMAK